MRDDVMINGEKIERVINTWDDIIDDTLKFDENFKYVKNIEELNVTC